MPSNQNSLITSITLNLVHHVGWAMPTSEHHHHMVMVGKAHPTGLGTGDWANIQICIDAVYDTFHNNYII